ncbi:MAG: glycosyltransferase family protein [Planctomycetota bacterium]|jgi:glycosyltransferase involved in cell wall biosynthesis
MRILLISTFFPPQHAVASLRTHAFATQWAEAGHEVTVLTTAKRADQRGMPRPSPGVHLVEIPYHGPRLVEWLRNRRRRPAVDASVPPMAGQAASAAGRLGPMLERLRSRHGIFAARRMPDLTDGWVHPATEWAMDQSPWDLAVSSSGPYTPHLVARSLRRAGVVRRWIADFRDLWVDNHLGGGVWPFTIRERALQRDCLATCDLTTTVSDGMAAILGRSEGLGETPVAVVHNGFDPADFAALDPRPAFADADPRVVRLVYTGSIHRHGQDVSGLFEAIARLRRRGGGVAPRIEVLVAGTPTEPWTDAARRAGVPDALRTLGTVPREEALRLQRDAHAVLSVAWAGPRSGGLSGKVFEYVAGRAPVLVIGGDADAPIVRFVESCGRGVHAGGDAEAIAATLERLAAGTLDVGPADRERIAEFTRERQARRMLELAAAHGLLDGSENGAAATGVATDEAGARVRAAATPSLPAARTAAGRA